MNQAISQAPPSHATLMTRATYLSVATALLLIGIKAFAWLLSGSLAILASLIDSCMDSATSIVNLLAVRYSLKSADADHKFGHGKAEALAGLGQSVFIAGSAAFLLINAVDRLTDPRPLAGLGTGMGIMLVAVTMTLLLVGYMRRVVRITGSSAIKADSLHYTSDIFTNLATIAALFFAHFGVLGMDPLLALAISFYIIHSAWGIGIESIHLLMDHELPADLREIIRNIAIEHGSVLGIHDLRTRKSGRIHIIQLHLELDDRMPLLKAHAIAKEVERRIRERFPVADIIIHQDPISLADRGHHPNRAAAGMADHRTISARNKSPGQKT